MQRLLFVASSRGTSRHARRLPFVPVTLASAAVFLHAVFLPQRSRSTCAILRLPYSHLLSFRPESEA